jgi:hypothetical protein
VLKRCGEAKHWRWRTASEGGPCINKPRARRLLEKIGLREVARIKASATLKNEESLPPQKLAATRGAGAIPVGV